MAVPKDVIEMINHVEPKSGPTCPTVNQLMVNGAVLMQVATDNQILFLWKHVNVSTRMKYGTVQPEEYFRGYRDALTQIRSYFGNTRLMETDQEEIEEKMRQCLKRRKQGE